MLAGRLGRQSGDLAPKFRSLAPQVRRRAIGGELQRFGIIGSLNVVSLQDAAVHIQAVEPIVPRPRNYMSRTDLTRFPAHERHLPDL
jgi:hypothetical protein